MAGIAAWIEKLIRFFAKVSAVLVIVLSLLVVYDALNRYLFHGGSVALQEMEWHLFDILFLLGLSYTLQQDKHVRVDIFYASFSPRTKAVIEIISQLLMILPFTALVLYVSWDFVMQSYLQHEISSDPGGLTHRYLIKGMILVGFALLGLQSLVILWKNIRFLRGER
ncbi:MAG: C4-dicarboxylate ABC transporter [Sulfurospirillum sp.]|nr:MAG: C4-dicarboxylate ABC transporter [Sulfurospirillum sp.]